MSLVTFAPLMKAVTRMTVNPDQVSLSSNESSNYLPSEMLEAHKIETNFLPESKKLEAKKKTNPVSLDSTTSTASSSNTSVHKKSPLTKNLKKNLLLAFGSLGVIYGDLGTSPLYVFSTVFADYQPSDDELYGAMSCIFWLFTIVVILKYSLIVLQLGPFKKEGGQIAIYVKLIKYLRIKKYMRNTLICDDDYDEEFEENSFEENKDQVEHDQRDLESQNDHSSITSRFSKRSIHDDGVVDLDTASMNSKMFYYKSTFIHKMLSHFLVFACFLGCSLVVSDGLLTPTTSVLSAIGGISSPVPALSKYVMPISVVILVFLFMIQRFGSGRVSFVFAPVIFLWLITIFVIGIINIVKYDRKVIRSLNPKYAVLFLHKRSIFSLGAILLSVTGCEAMFADVGHFNQISIQITLIVFVYPCLMTCYLGQTAFMKLHRDSKTIENLFYSSVPGGTASSNGFYWFVFVLATLATIIASQALILSVFSILKQLIKLKYFPRFNIIQTSKTHKGQIYIPIANWMLMIAVCLTTIGFRNSANVTAAYGTGISIDFCVTTALITFCIIYIYNKNIALAVSFLVVFGALDVTLMIASMKKVPKGAWFPLVVCFTCILFLYFYNHYIGKKEQKLQELIFKQYQQETNGQISHAIDVYDIKLVNNVTVDEKILQFTQTKSRRLFKLVKWFL